MKNIRLILAFVLIFACMLVFIACEDEPTDSTTTTTINYYNGDVLIHTDTVKVDDFTVYTMPSVDDKLFDGYYFDSALTMPFSKDKISEHVDNNMLNIYAKYIDNTKKSDIHVYFNVGDTLYFDSILNDNGFFAVPDNPQQNNFTFKGWYLDTDFYERFDPISAQKDNIDMSITVYAKMTPNVNKVTFHVNGKVYHTMTIIGNTPSERPDDPMLNEYEFLCWEYLGGKEVFDIDEYLARDIHESINVYARFGKTTTHVYLYSNNDLINIIDVHKGEHLVLPALDITPSQEFLGWNLDDKAFDIDAFNNKTYRDDISLHASYKERTSKANIYIDNTYLKTVTIGGDLVLELPVPSDIDGKVFDDWYVKIGNTYEILSYEKHIANIERSDIDVYARYKDIITTIRYMDGKDEIMTHVITDKESITLENARPKNGYTFDYWECNGVQFDVQKFNHDLLNNTVDKEYILTAKYTPIKYILQLFDMQGNDITMLEFTLDDNATLPDAPKIDKMVFDGWYIDQKYSARFDFDAYKKTEMAKVKAIYAHYVPTA